MTTQRPTLSVLDLVPVTSGSNASTAIANTVDLARKAEAAGYHRYWVAEHHLNPGVAGTTPSIVITLIAGATQRIRVGSGAVQMGHHTPLAVVEQFGLLDAAFPGRIDLGLGRSGFRRGATPPTPPTPPVATKVTDRGLIIPAPFSFARLAGSPRFALQASLLQQPDAVTPDYEEQVDDILRLLAGSYRSADGASAWVVPGTDAPLDIWILGSSGGSSAEVAGRRGLPFGANYHVAPSAVLEAVDAYRRAFVPSTRLDRPRVLVSADVVVSDDDTTARELASGYGLWVRSIRTGQGAIPFPSPHEARAHLWTEEDRALVQDRIATQFVGSAMAVADGLEALAAETGADELLVTTITHQHRDRVRSFQLLAEEWRRREVGAVAEHQRVGSSAGNGA